MLKRAAERILIFGLNFVFTEQLYDEGLDKARMAACGRYLEVNTWTATQETFIAT
jgi:hypothetical protein